MLKLYINNAIFTYFPTSLQKYSLVASCTQVHKFFSEVGRTISHEAKDKRLQRRSAFRYFFPIFYWPLKYLYLLSIFTWALKSLKLPSDCCCFCIILLIKICRFVLLCLSEDLMKENTEGKAYHPCHINGDSRAYFILSEQRCLKLHTLIPSESFLELLVIEIT